MEGQGWGKGPGNSYHRPPSEAREHIGFVFGPLEISGDLAIEAFGFEFCLLVGLLGQILLTHPSFYSSSKK